MSLVDPNLLPDAIEDALKGDTGASGVNTLVGGRIYYAAVPQNVELPFVLFTQISDAQYSDFENDRISSEWQFDIYGRVEDGSVAMHNIAKAIGDLFHRQTKTNGTATFRFACTGQGRLTQEQDAYRIIMTFHVWSA